MKKCILFSIIILLFVACEKPQPTENPTMDDILNTTESIEVSGIKYNMVLVKAGTFMMGALEGDTMAVNTEMPRHQVTLTQDYYIGGTEVTQELYEAVTGKNPSHFKGAKLPVDGVTYSEALDFCKALGDKTGHTFTLPTEAQWEYAARGGHKAPEVSTLFAGSNDLDEVAWYWGNTQYVPDSGMTCPVATKRPNELGLYDMSGNVWEWCLDWSAFYDSTPAVDPMGPETGQYRVLKGGSWYNNPWRCRVSYRYNNYPEGDDYVHVIGFRVVMIP